MVPPDRARAAVAIVERLEPLRVQASEVVERAVREWVAAKEMKGSIVTDAHHEAKMRAEAPLSTVWNLLVALARQDAREGAKN